MYNVLVCDDDKAILDSLEIYLNLEGYKVFKAENGRQALKTAEENDLQCIILDIMMPDLDGLKRNAEAPGEQKHTDNPALCQE